MSFPLFPPASQPSAPAACGQPTAMRQRSLPEQPFAVHLCLGTDFLDEGILLCAHEAQQRLVRMPFEQFHFLDQDVAISAWRNRS